MSGDLDAARTHLLNTLREMQIVHATKALHAAAVGKE